MNIYLCPMEYDCKQLIDEKKEYNKNLIKTEWRRTVKMTEIKLISSNKNNTKKHPSIIIFSKSNPLIYYYIIRLLFIPTKKTWIYKSCNHPCFFLSNNILRITNINKRVAIIISIINNKICQWFDVLLWKWQLKIFFFFSY